MRRTEGEEKKEKLIADVVDVDAQINEKGDRRDLKTKQR